VATTVAELEIESDQAGCEQLLISWSHRVGYARRPRLPCWPASPYPSSSGQVVRYRLNRGGDRQLNRGLHTIVMIREAWHEPTKRYVARRTAEGKSPREVRRCLARAVARGLYRLLECKVAPSAA
jgi:transposase